MRSLPPVFSEVPVRVFNPHNHKWELETVQDSIHNPRSYVVKM